MTEANAKATVAWPEGNESFLEKGWNTVWFPGSKGRWRPKTGFRIVVINPERKQASIASRPMEVARAS